MKVGRILHSRAASYKNFSKLANIIPGLLSELAGLDRVAVEDRWFQRRTFVSNFPTGRSFQNEIRNAFVLKEARDSNNFFWTFFKIALLFFALGGSLSFAATGLLLAIPASLIPLLISAFFWVKFRMDLNRAREHFLKLYTIERLQC